MGVGKRVFAIRGAAEWSMSWSLSRTTRRMCCESGCVEEQPYTTERSFSPFKV
jgi:hypothetical protein